MVIPALCSIKVQERSLSRKSRKNMQLFSIRTRIDSEGCSLSITEKSVQRLRT